MEAVLRLLLFCAVGTAGQRTPRDASQDQMDFFSGVLTDGVRVDGTVHMESTTDFHFQITLYFRRPRENRDTGTVFKVYTKFTAQGCDMRNLQTETGATLQVPNRFRLPGRFGCNNRFVQPSETVKAFCEQSEKPTVDLPVFKNTQDVTPTLTDDGTFKWTDSLHNVSRNALSRFGIDNGDDWVDATGTDAEFHFYDAVPMFSGLEFKVKLSGYALDLDRALTCKKSSEFYNQATCIFMEEVLKALNGNADEPLFDEEIDVGKSVYDFVGPQQNYVMSDGTFIVGNVGAVCQTTTDPFVLTVNDPGALDMTNNAAFLSQVNSQLQAQLQNCLPAGYTADGAISALRVVQGAGAGQPLQIAGEMGAAARKNPAALLRCIQTLQGQQLLNTATVNEVAFQPRAGECSGENAKYYACDANKEYVVNQPRVTRTTMTTTGDGQVAGVTEGSGATAGIDVTRATGPTGPQEAVTGAVFTERSPIPAFEIVILAVLVTVVLVILVLATVVIVMKTIQWRKNIALVENTKDDSVFDCKFSDGLGLQYNARLDTAKENEGEATETTEIVIQEESAVLPETMVPAANEEIMTF